MTNQSDDPKPEQSKPSEKPVSRDVCPRCGSPFVKAGWFRRFPVIAAIGAVWLGLFAAGWTQTAITVVLFVLMAAVGYVKRNWVCEHCGHRWWAW
jgi:hypothetical protein